MWFSEKSGRDRSVPSLSERSNWAGNNKWLLVYGGSAAAVAFAVSVSAGSVGDRLLVG